MLPLRWQTRFPIWDKAQWIPQNEGSQSGFTITLRLGNPMTQSFFFQPLWVVYQAANKIKPGTEFEGNPLFLWHQVQVAGWV